MKKALLTLVVLGTLGASVYAYYTYRQTGPKFTVTTSPVTRGDVVDTVGATGTLQAVTTVQVGTQVSGTIQSLSADFNSLVKKGQVLARLDPSLFQTQIEQARANLIRAQADLERLKVGLDDAKAKFARAQELSGRNLIPRQDLDTADVNVRAADAQLKSSEAQVTQAQASLNQNEVSMAHTVIEAPIDGLVISRNVDVGQTVAASLQAPVLYVLAADLTKMQVLANLDESDVGRIRPGQKVSFRVDAYPTETFSGNVSQVRLSPTVQQNVVTYATVINAPNDQLKLKPGMTANVTIEIARTTNVLRIPNASLRFRPTNDMYAALGQTPPDPAARGEGFGTGGRRGGQAPGAASQAPSTTDTTSAPVPSAAAPATAAGGRTGGMPTTAAVSEGSPSTAGAEPPAGRGAASADTTPATAGARGGSGTTGGRRGFGGGGRGANPGDATAGGADAAAGGGRGGFASRMQNMSPEERDRALQRMRDRGIDPSAAGGATGARGRGAAPAAAPAKNAGAPTPPAATTIDALFGPLPRTETVGRVWLLADNQLKPVRVRLGITDGQATELIEGDLQQGSELITNMVTTNTAARPAASAAGNPFLGQTGRGGFPGGGGGGFGGGGNRGGGGR